MRKVVLDDMIARAQRGETTLAKCAAAAIEVGVVVPSILEQQLVEAGYFVDAVPGTGHGVWVSVTTTDPALPRANQLPPLGEDGTFPPEPFLVARAFSHDRADALLQAIAAELREEVQ